MNAKKSIKIIYTIKSNHVYEITLQVKLNCYAACISFNFDKIILSFKLNT